MHSENELIPHAKDKMSLQPTSHRIGVHCSIAGGHHKALYLGRDLGCEVVQIFTKNNMQWKGSALTDESVRKFRAARDETGIKTIFAHAGYLINLASNNPENLEKSRISLLDELERCRLLELPFIVLHPGAHLWTGEEEGLERILDSLDWIFHRFEGTTRIALEATAGQGTLLGGKIEHLAMLLNASHHRKRLRICLDTCHLFAAGYDLRTKADIEKYIAEFSQLLPWEKVVCVHLNDSKGPLGGRKDRHALLGQGQIGWECFQVIMGHDAFAEIPLCLETPKGKDNINDLETLRKLKKLRGNSLLKVIE